IQVISRVREGFGVELPLSALFETPTIAQLAAGLGDGRWSAGAGGVPPLERISRDGDLPVSFVQERLWFLDQFAPGANADHVPLALRVKGPLDPAALQRGVDEIVRRHEALRTRLVSTDGILRQIILPSVALPLEPIDLAAVPAGEREARLRSVLDEVVRRGFDLGAAPLARLALVRLAAEEHAVLLVMHHVICDGWSLTLFFRELEALYRAFVAGKPAPELPELPLQPVDFTAW